MKRSGPVRRWSASATATVVLALGAVLLSGCVSPRNSLGTSSSPCYQALPVAEAAVHHSGTLAGIRLVGQSELAKYASLEQVLDTRAGHAVRNACVVSFHGSFTLAHVDKPLGPAPTGGTGAVAFVIVSSPQNVLLGTLVLEHEPLRLRHEV